MIAVFLKRQAPSRSIDHTADGSSMFMVDLWAWRLVCVALFVSSANHSSPPLFSSRRHRFGKMGAAVLHTPKERLAQASLFPHARGCCLLSSRGVYVLHSTDGGIGHAAGSGGRHEGVGRTGGIQEQAAGESGRWRGAAWCICCHRHLVFCSIHVFDDRNCPVRLPNSSSSSQLGRLRSVTWQALLYFEVYGATIVRNAGTFGMKVVSIEQGVWVPEQQCFNLVGCFPSGAHLCGGGSGDGSARGRHHQVRASSTPTTVENPNVSTSSTLRECRMGRFLAATTCSRAASFCESLDEPARVLLLQYERRQLLCSLCSDEARSW